MENTKPRWGTIKEYADEYHISPSLAYQHAHAEGFPVKKIGKRGLRINLDEVSTWLDKFYGLASEWSYR